MLGLHRAWIAPTILYLTRYGIHCYFSFFQAFQSRNMDGAFALITGAQLIAYITIFWSDVFETKGQELAPAFVYLALCVAPAWVGFRSRDGEHAAHRSRALMLSNAVLTLLMVLWGLDVIVFPTSFLRVSEWRGQYGSFFFYKVEFSCALRGNYSARSTCSVLCRPNQALQL